MRFALVIFSCSLLCAGLACAQATYEGSDACAWCHGTMGTSYDVFQAWYNSGHHWILNPINPGNPAPPDYPFSSVPNAPNTYTWDDVSYIIGGYYWKARFVNEQGYNIIGNSVQYNIYNNFNTWTGFYYTPYDCGGCHATGYDSTGHQGGRPGITGHWAENGVGCEACHGPGSLHVANPTTNPLVVDPSAAACGVCHHRSALNLIPYGAGFIKHHEQYEELVRSPHVFMDCVDCHDPHKSTVYGWGGVREDITCQNCHPGNYQIAGMENLDCQDCHMAYAVRSAFALNLYRGDVHSHIFNINASGEPRDSVVYQVGTHQYMALDDNGWAQLTLDWVCLSCHTTMSLSQAAAFAHDIHLEHPSGVRVVNTENLPDRFAVVGAFPNPFNLNTVVEFTLDRPGVVQADLYNVRGRWINSPYSGRLTAGTHHLGVEGTNLASGIYFLRLQTGERAESIKLVLLK